MANKIFMTALSPTMEQGTIVEWKVKEGDAVKSGDILAEIETDKATMELLADDAGVILKIIKGNGSEGNVGDIIGAIGKAGEDVSAIIAEANGSSASPAPSAPVASAPAPVAVAPKNYPASNAKKIFMTALSPTMEMGTIQEWKVKVGDSVKSGDVLAEIETDKASMELLADDAGVILKIIRNKGDEAKVGDIIGAIGQAGENTEAIEAEAKGTPAPAVTSPAPVAVAPTSAPAPKKASPAVASAGDGERIKASPLARRLATQRGIDLNFVTGTGTDGRITSADLDNERVPLASVAKKNLSAGGSAHSNLNNDLIPLTGKRKVIAQRLTESKNSAPHFYLMTSIEMDNLLASREMLNKGRKEGKIGVNAFLMKLIAQVVTRHQVINSSWMGDAVQNHDQVDIGLAVAQPDGLITPIVKACEQKGIIQIDAELADLVARARTNKLKPDEYSGATFTISSLGSMGIEQFTSIINPPGVAILAIGSVKKEVVVGAGDEICVKSMMKVSLSCDHRVVDGAVGARFLKDLRDTLENPIMALY